MAKRTKKQTALLNAENVIQEEQNKQTKVYEGDFRRFKLFAEEQGLPISFETLETYLLHTIQQGLKLSTFNKRYAAVKHYLVSELGLDSTDTQMKRIALLRRRYNDIDYAALKQLDGQIARPRYEVTQRIEQLDVRAKAIALFNLVTACRPSEMVSIQIKHIDMENQSVNVYLKKQKVWHSKRLTHDVIAALRTYITEYKLDDESYLVGKLHKHGTYYSVKVSEKCYREAIHRWLGFAPYTLRKTQISAMHEAGADLATIAKQSGHKSLETINKHYLAVNDKTLDKFL